ncbi:MAG: tetratricopeptide repeat protein [Chitinivibrionales bacterium]
MIGRRTKWLIYACILFVSSSYAEKSDSDAFGEEKKIKLIIAKPVDANATRNERDGWFAGLSELLLHFRLQASNQIGIVSPAKVDAFVTQRGPTISGFSYENLARQMGATHVLLVNYEISRDGKNVQYYAELRDFGKKQQLLAYEEEFPIQSVGQNIDLCVMWLYEKTGLTLESDLERFYSLDVLSSGKQNRLLGEFAHAAVSNDEQEAERILPRLAEIIDKDPRNILAQYLAAQALETAGEHLRAAEVLKDLIMVLPNCTNLYVKACRNYRLSGRNQQALTYAADAESKGVRSLDLMIEGGLALEALGKRRRASNVFESVLEKYPTDMEGLLFFARYHNTENNADKAIEFADKILKGSPDNGYALLEKGIALSGSKKYDEAIAILEKARRVLPGHPKVSRLLGDAHIGLNEYKPAARAYAQALEVTPGDFDLHLKAGRSWLKAGEAQEAMGSFLRSEQMFADSVILYKEIGVLAANMQDTANAIRYLERYTEKGAMEPEVLMLLGDIYTAGKNYERAFYMYNHAMPLMEDKNRTRFALGEFYIRKGDPNAAIGYLQDIIEEQPRYPEARRLLADAFFASGNQSEALPHYLAARKQDDANVHVQRRIALIKFEAQDYSAAEREYLTLLRQDSKDPTAYFYLAIISLHHKNSSKADARLKQAMEQGTPNAEMLFQLGQGFRHVDKMREAIKFYSQCLEMQPQHQQAQMALAETYVEIKDPKRAAEGFRKLFEMDTVKYADYLAEAGFLYDKASAPAEARQCYSQYLKSGYENAQVNLHLARLEFRYHMYEKVIGLIGDLQKDVSSDEKYIRILAESYYKTQDFKNAVAWFKRIVDQKDVETDVIEMTAVSCEKVGEISSARDYYKKLLSRVEKQKKPDIAFHIGELYEAERMEREARKQYLDNVALYPSDLRNYDKMIAFYQKDEDRASARELLEKLVGKPYSKPLYTKLLARICLDQNDKSNAIKYYGDLVTEKPDEFEGWFTIGQLYSERLAYGKALDALQAAVALDGKHFEAHMLYGVALKQTGDIQRAAQILSIAHRLDSRHIGVVTDLADCYRSLGNRKSLMGALKTLTALQPENFEAHVEFGNVLMDEGAVDEGIEVLKTATTINKKDVTVHLKLAHVYEKRNDQDSRYYHLKKALGRDNKNTDVLYETGRFYVESGKDKRAEKHFKKALDIDGENAKVCYAYGRMLFDSRQFQSAMHYLEIAVRQNRYNADYLAGYARAAYENDKKALALEMTEDALDVDGQHVGALSFAGRLYREKGQPERAESFLLRAIAHDRSRPEIYHQLGELALAKEEYTKASDFFKRSLEIGGYREESMIGLGRILIITCKDEKAREIFEEVLTRNSNQLEAFYRLTHLYIRGGFITEARELLAKHRNDKKTVWHHLAFGEWAEVEGDYQSAKISYTVALRLMPEISEAYAGLGRVNLQGKDYSTAIQNFARAQALDPYNPYLFLDMGKAYEGIGELKSAYDIYSNVAEKFPQIAEAYYRIASIISRKNQHSEALAIVKQGLENNPRDGKLYLAMGENYQQLGQYEQAIEAYSEAVKKGGKQCVEGLFRIANIYNKELRNQKEAKKYFKRYIKAGGENEEAKKQLNELAHI